MTLYVHMGGRDKSSSEGVRPQTFVKTVTHAFWHRKSNKQQQRQRQRQWQQRQQRQQRQQQEESNSTTRVALSKVNLAKHKHQINLVLR